MTGPRLELVTRVMKARRESVCLACGELIRPGDHIAKAGTWIHIRHVLERLHNHNHDQEDR
jgi:hypothetical protein